MILFRDYIVDTQGLLTPSECVPLLYNNKTGEYRKYSFEETHFECICGNEEKYKLRVFRHFWHSKICLDNLYVLENEAERILYG